MYSVITFKATNGPKLVKNNLTIEEATKLADVLYDSSKIFYEHNLLKSGVSLMVVTDENGMLFVEQGYLPPIFKNPKAIIYQYGSR